MYVFHLRIHNTRIDANFWHFIFPHKIANFMSTLSFSALLSHSFTKARVCSLISILFCSFESYRSSNHHIKPSYMAYQLTLVWSNFVKRDLFDSFFLLFAFLFDLVYMKSHSLHFDFWNLSRAVRCMVYAVYAVYRTNFMWHTFYACIKSNIFVPLGEIFMNHRAYCFCSISNAHTPTYIQTHT